MKTMHGQYLGDYSARVDDIEVQSGRVMLNVDEEADHYRAVTYIVPTDINAPPAKAVFRTDRKTLEGKNIRAKVTPIDRRYDSETTWDKIHNLYPETGFSEYANFDYLLKNDILHIRGKTEDGTSWNADLKRSTLSAKSDLTTNEITWIEYKEEVARLYKKRFLYRGQQQRWRLRTSFHRHQRYDVEKFVNSDISILHQQLSAKTKHVFNLSRDQENGAFVNLAQHHGFPTPLLDWTYSPYVAAYFAFRGVPKKFNGKDVARIILFDQEEWKARLPQINRIVSSEPHLSVLNLLAIENPRMAPQQAAITVTNIDDIEGYIRHVEGVMKTTFLTALDIPWRQRAIVMQELSFMGIAAGSMFPGLDGVCEELRERLFDR